MVDSSQIKPKQAAELCRKIRPMLGYIGRLRRRMELLGFPPDDPLYRATSDAHNAVQSLHVQVHYCSCKSGVGRDITSRT